MPLSVVLILCVFVTFHRIKLGLRKYILTKDKVY